MENKTDSVRELNFDQKTSKSTITTNPQNQYGRIKTGPYLPIQSGMYNIDVISTSDLKIEGNI